MIFPLLAGWVNFRQAPVTWSLVFINCLVFLWGNGSQLEVAERLEELMSDDFYIEAQGQIYSRYLELRPLPPEDVTQQIAQRGAKDRQKLLGHLAFRDHRFLLEAPEMELIADRVALHYWRDQLNHIRSLQSVHPSYTLGVSADSNQLPQWLTYIFSHTTGVHFLGNMLFLVLFGGALETLIGGLGLLIVFLLSGVFSAGVFLLLSGATTAPLVGASGSVSGIMTLFCVLQWREPQRFVYWWLLPFRGSMGFIYLPASVIFAIWFLTDLAGHLSALPPLGGVAHSAHLGGDVAGALVGLVLLMCGPDRFKNKKGDPRIEMGRLYPFLPPRKGFTSPLR